MRDALLMLLTVGCALMALQRPFYGLLAYLWYSLMAPYSLTFGVAKAFPHVAVIAACTLVGFFASAEPKTLPKQGAVKLLLGLWIWFGFTTLVAISPEEALPKFISMSKILLMVFLAMYLVNTGERVQLMMKVVALSLGFHALKVGVYVIRTGGQAAVYGPDDSFLEANNALGMALAMNVPLLFYLMKIEVNVWMRRLMQAMLLLSYPAIAGTFSRGAWLAVAAATALFLLKDGNRKLMVLTAVVVMMMSPLLIPMIQEKAFISDQLSDRVELLKNYEEDDSAQSRFWNWEFCRRVGSSHPIEGGGFNLYSRDAYLKYYPEFLEKYPTKVWSCHNMWLTVFAEHGALAFMAWVGLLGQLFIMLRRLRTFAIRHELLWLKYYSRMFEAVLIAFCISGTFLDIPYFELYYFFLVAIVSLQEQVRTEALLSAPAVDDEERSSYSTESSGSFSSTHPRLMGNH